jgi:hypothetical protein
MSTKRKQTSYPKEWYMQVIDAYEGIKGVKFSGSEYMPLQQECKTMFLNGREVKDIIGCMKAFNSTFPDWTLKTVRMRIAEYVAGRIKDEGADEKYRQEQIKKQEEMKNMKGKPLPDWLLKQRNELAKKLSIN